MWEAVMDFYEASKFAYYYIVIISMIMGAVYWEFMKYAWKIFRDYIKQFKIVRVSDEK